MGRGAKKNCMDPIVLKRNTNLLKNAIEYLLNPYTQCCKLVILYAYHWTAWVGLFATSLRWGFGKDCIWVLISR